jgi:hypothetical protein
VTISAVIPVMIDGSHVPRCRCTGLRQFQLSSALADFMNVRHLDP